MLMYTTPPVQTLCLGAGRIKSRAIEPIRISLLQVTLSYSYVARKNSYCPKCSFCRYKPACKQSHFHLWAYRCRAEVVFRIGVLKENVRKALLKDSGQLVQSVFFYRAIWH